MKQSSFFGLAGIKMKLKNLVEAKESDFALGRDVESPFIGQQRAREVQLEKSQGNVQLKIMKM